MVSVPGDFSITKYIFRLLHWDNTYPLPLIKNHIMNINFDHWFDHFLLLLKLNRTEHMLSFLHMCNTHSIMCQHRLDWSFLMILADNRKSLGWRRLYSQNYFDMTYNVDSRWGHLCWLARSLVTTIVLSEPPNHPARRYPWLHGAAWCCMVLHGAHWHHHYLRTGQQSVDWTGSTF